MGRHFPQCQSCIHHLGESIGFSDSGLKGFLHLSCLHFHPHHFLHCLFDSLVVEVRLACVLISKGFQGGVQAYSCSFDPVHFLPFVLFLLADHQVEVVGMSDALPSKVCKVLVARRNGWEHVGLMKVFYHLFLHLILSFH